MIDFGKNISRKSLSTVRDSQPKETKKNKTEKAVHVNYDFADRGNTKALLNLHAAEFDFDNKQDDRQDSPDF